MPLRLVVHDYSGHPFQVQLSRELARRGHRVLHLHCPSYRSGKGAVELLPEDPETLSIEPVALDGVFEKYSPVRRLRQEREYGRKLALRVREARPDVLLSSNTPLLAQRVFLSISDKTPFVFWQQDIYSYGMKREAERRLPVVGGLLGHRFIATERRMLEQSSAVVTISDDFRTELLRWGLPSRRLHVIENWAPLEELPQGKRDNPWAREQGLADKRVLLYSGTLGLKHDPELLLRLAQSFEAEPDVRVVVCSEGIRADHLRARRSENLVVLGFQPYERLPDVLATGDVLLAILESTAGRFAVPSKILTYLCAGRPLLAAVPAANLAARVVRLSKGGIVVDPHEVDEFIAAGHSLLADPELRSRLGTSARAYAERTFDIASIGDRFEEILESVVSGTQVVSRS
jgi:putative colanic acid biosynthesis glycosyltransferase WcaI